jgi:putative tricarboxylic transport membrane protein
MIEAADVQAGLLLILQPENMLWLLAGFVLGLVVGSIPGMSESTALAVLLPFTLYMDPWAAIFMMTGAYVSAEVSGSYPAILMNIPGTPGCAASTFEGYPLTQRGEAGQAIGISVTGSAVGTFAGGLLYMVVGPAFGVLALAFGSPEMFMLAVLGMTAVASLTGTSVAKGLMSALLGLLLACIGLDLFNALPRATFGYTQIYDSLPILPALLGLFGFAEILSLARREYVVKGEIRRYEGLKAPLQGVRIALRHPGQLSLATMIGLVIGIIPGLGATAASVVAYGQAKQWSRNPDQFGKGAYEGLLATETANNSVIPGALIPTFTLGVPGSGTTVLFLAALMLQGVRPGPGFFENYGPQADAVGWALLACSVLILLVCMPLAGTFARIATVPTRILIPFVIVASVAGVYSARQEPLDIVIMVLFGVLGYLLAERGYSPVALLLGLILGRLLEENLFRSIAVAGPWVFFEKPISLFLFVLSVGALATPLVAKVRASRARRAEVQRGA